jgi:hypothetical protein
MVPLFGLTVSAGCTIGDCGLTNGPNGVPVWFNSISSVCWMHNRGQWFNQWS